MLDRRRQEASLSDRFAKTHKTMTAALLRQVPGDVDDGDVADAAHEQHAADGGGAMVVEQVVVPVRCEGLGEDTL